MKARFGPLIVDERKFAVMHGASRLAISRKAVELLVCLGQSINRPLRREALMRDLWPDREVSDKALSMLVVELRRQLLPFFAGEDPIRTAPGVGYSLCMPYESSDLPSELAFDLDPSLGRMAVAVAAPTLLSSGEQAAQLRACWHDTLLNALGSEPGLKVSTRATDAEDDSARLTLVVQSSVRIIKDDVMLSVRCVNPRDQEICWAATERAPLADSFGGEERLCERLCSELRQASSQYRGLQAWREYRHSAGFDALAEGNKLVDTRNVTSMFTARERFAQALRLDPNCAPALVGMADCEILGAFYDDTELAQTAQRATSYVERALALNPGLASAHATRGLINLLQLRFDSAEKALLEAIRLDDSCAIALQWYADFLASQGRLREAVQVGYLAVARAPRSGVVNAQLGQLLHMARMFDEAQVQLERTLTLEPTIAGPHCFLALNLAVAGRREAIESAQRAVTLSPNTPFYRGVLGSILAQFGERERAQQQLHALEAKAAKTLAFAEAAMLVATALGQTKRAIDWFRVATAHGAVWSLYAATWPMLGAMRAENSFQVLVRSRGMEMVTA